MNSGGLTLCVAGDPPPVTVTVSVTVDVAAPPPLLTQMIMTSLTVVLCSMRTLLSLFELELELKLLLPVSLELDTSELATRASRPTAPRAAKSAWRVPANASGAAHNAVMTENLMLIY